MTSRSNGEPELAWPSESDGIKMLMYGMSGSGKTTVWATFPGPILALICSGGNNPGELRSVNTPELRKKITPLKIQSIEQVKGMIERAKEGVATLVLDHGTGLQDLALKEILGIDEIPAQKGWGLATQQQYGQCTLQCKELFRAMLGLPCNVVIVAQERTFGGGDDNGTSEIITPTIGAALTPSLTGWLNTACDYVVETFKRGKVETQEGTIAGKVVKRTNRLPGVEYCMRTAAHEIFMTKFRVPRGQYIPEVVVDPNYDKIMKVIRGEK